MKKLIKKVEMLVTYYKFNSDKYVPIYVGEELISFGKVEH